MSIGARRLGRQALRGAMAALAALGLAACGSSAVQTVTRPSTAAQGPGSPSQGSAAVGANTATSTTAQPPTATSTTGSTAGTGGATTSAPQTTPTPSPPTNESNGGTNASPRTHTAAAPQFTEHESSGGPLSLSAAEQILAERGYRAIETNGYRSEQELSVLTGAGITGEHAFFFTHGTYLGTDASEASRSITVVSHSGSEVTLAYGLYGAGGAAAGTAPVRFKLEDGKLAPLDPIPSESSRQ